MGTVAFDYGRWAAVYPELVPNSNPDKAENYFDIACTMLNPTEASIVRSEKTRGRLLYLLTAHLMKMFDTKDGDARLVGSVGTAVEGSVTLTMNAFTSTASNQWFLQTQYGATFWQATSPYRTMHYVVDRGRPVDPWFNRNIVGIR